MPSVRPPRAKAAKAGNKTAIYSPPITVQFPSVDSADLLEPYASSLSPEDMENYLAALVPWQLLEAERASPTIAAFLTKTPEVKQGVFKTHNMHKYGPFSPLSERGTLEAYFSDGCTGCPNPNPNRVPGLKIALCDDCVVKKFLSTKALAALAKKKNIPSSFEPVFYISNWNLEDRSPEKALFERLSPRKRDALKFGFLPFVEEAIERYHENTRTPLKTKHDLVCQWQAARTACRKFGELGESRFEEIFGYADSHLGLEQEMLSTEHLRELLLFKYKGHPFDWCKEWGIVGRVIRHMAGTDVYTPADSTTSVEVLPPTPKPYPVFPLTQ